MIIMSLAKINYRNVQRKSLVHKRLIDKYLRCVRKEIGLKSQTNIAVLEQPPYSSDLAPYDLFPKFKVVIKGTHSPELRAIKRAVTKELLITRDNVCLNCVRLEGINLEGANLQFVDLTYILWDFSTVSFLTHLIDSYR